MDRRDSDVEMEGLAVAETAVSPPAPGPPVDLRVDYPERLSRWRLFLKWLLVIPAVIVLEFYAIAAFVTTFISFWAILFTGRYPRGLFEFARGFMALWARTLAYFPLLLTDRYPLAGLADGKGEERVHYEAEYPERLSRGVLLLKLVTFLLSVVGVLTGIAGLLLILAAIPVWFAILITGRYPRGMFNFVVSVQRWTLRVTAWQWLMRDEWSLFATTPGVAALVAIGAVLATGVALVVLPRALRDAGEVGGPVLSAANLYAVGNCFDFPTGAELGVVDIGEPPPLADCDSPHDAEVYEILEHTAGPGEPYPGSEVVGVQASFQCLPGFQGFVGTAYETSGLDIYALFPLEETWEAGDRRIVCAVFRVDRGKLTGTARGSGL